MSVTSVQTHVHVAHDYVVASSLQGAVLCHRFAARDGCQQPEKIIEVDVGTRNENLQHLVPKMRSDDFCRDAAR